MNIEKIIDEIRQTLREIDFKQVDMPIISMKNGREFKDIQLSDKLFLLSAIGLTDIKAEEVNSVLEKRVKDYSINYSTGDISITYNEPISYYTTTIYIGDDNNDNR